jgi:hypothetical protein
MDYAIVYLARRFVFRCVDFFHHWYLDGSRAFVGRFVQLLKDMDQTLAFRLTLKHFFEPLWKDYTVMGRILGFIFRSLRVALAFLIYPIFGLVFIVIYGIWLLVPPLTLIYGFGLLPF